MVRLAAKPLAHRATVRADDELRILGAYMSPQIDHLSFRDPFSPMVTVAIPAYNASSYISDTINAVRNQLYADWELVVVDNASTDETPLVLDRLLAGSVDSRIRVFRNTRTVPAPANWNIALSHARGRYLKLLCADDLPTPDCLGRQVTALNTHPSASLASGSRIIINSRGQRLFTTNGVGTTGLYSGHDTIRRCIMAGTNIVGEPVSVMWRRDAMEKCGVFDTEIAYATDAEYWLRLLGVGDLFFDAQPVGSYRIHSGAATTRLAAVTVEDFLRTARKQVARGTVRLSPFDFCVVRAKSWLKSKARQLIYRTLG